MINFLNTAITKFFGISSKIINQFRAKGVKGGTGEYYNGGKFEWFANMLDGFNTILYPIIIAVMAAGAIYAIILGINLARAETSEKREEAKKRMIWAIIGVAFMFIVIIVIEVVAANAGTILDIPEVSV